MAVIGFNFSIGGGEFVIRPTIPGAVVTTLSNRVGAKLLTPGNSRGNEISRVRSLSHRRPTGGLAGGRLV